MANNVVENYGVIEIPSRPISILTRSIEIEIPNKKPKIIILNFQVIKLVHKIVPSWLSTRPINHHKSPALHIMGRGHRESNSKRMFFQGDNIEESGGPTNKDPS